MKGVLSPLRLSWNPTPFSSISCLHTCKRKFQTFFPPHYARSGTLCVLVCCRTTSVLLQTLIAFFMSAERWYGTLTVECTLCIYPTVPNKALLYLLSFSHHHQESHCKNISWKICIVQTWQTSGYGRIVLLEQEKSWNFGSRSASCREDLTFLDQ